VFIAILAMKPQEGAAMLSAKSATDPSISLTVPNVRRIDPGDLRDALIEGVDDFVAMPTHSFFLIAIYPVVGMVLFRLTFGYDVLPLIFPLAAGFALLGPLAMVGVYELSRRRQKGLPPSWSAADILYFSRLRPLMAFGMVLMTIFLTWLIAAFAIYRSCFGEWTPQSMSTFVDRIISTREGWSLILMGCSVGLLFAALTFTISVVSVPMILDQEVSVAVAIVTSMKTVLANPTTMALWAVIIAVGLAIGSAPAFFGLAIVLPVFGHAIWRLYCKAVER
jgi:uncharacterized membrane protein